MFRILILNTYYMLQKYKKKVGRAIFSIYFLVLCKNACKFVWQRLAINSMDVLWPLLFHHTFVPLRREAYQTTLDLIYITIFIST